MPFAVWAVFFALLFTVLNLRGIQATARTNEILAAGMGVVILCFFVAAVRYVCALPRLAAAYFYAALLRSGHVFRARRARPGTSIAVLTYIGFDGISTLSEEVENPRRNILLATVLTCLITGVLASLEVYAAQLVWPDSDRPSRTSTPRSCTWPGAPAGLVLFHVVNAHAAGGDDRVGHRARSWRRRGCSTAWAATTRFRSGFFGALDPQRGHPAQQRACSGCAGLVGAFLLSYQLGAEMLNFGAFIAFMGVNCAAFMRYWVRARRRR